MSEGNVEIVRRGYALFVAGDLEAVAALFSTDAELAGAGGLGVAGTAPDTRYGPEGFIRTTEEALEPPRNAGSSFCKSPKAVVRRDAEHPDAANAETV
jgi:ketosteroid isomerase-like protein